MLGTRVGKANGVIWVKPGARDSEAVRGCVLCLWFANTRYRLLGG